MSNYETMKDRMSSHFLEYDQEKMIRKFSLKADENYLYLRFVGRDYRISRKNGRIEWNREEIGKDYFEPAQAGFEETLAIMDVLCSSKDDCQLAGTYNTIDRISLYAMRRRRAPASILPMRNSLTRIRKSSRKCWKTWAARKTIRGMRPQSFRFLISCR